MKRNELKAGRLKAQRKKNIHRRDAGYAEINYIWPDFLRGKIKPSILYSRAMP
jgi:hypothetical protein